MFIQILSLITIMLGAFGFILELMCFALYAADNNEKGAYITSTAIFIELIIAAIVIICC